jgi:energy-coupling factor transporter ATP-binding protein EcfA2
METNKDFYKKLKSSTANFMLFDAHAHSVASADYLHPDRFSELSDEEKNLIYDLAKSYAIKNNGLSEKDWGGLTNEEKIAKLNSFQNKWLDYEQLVLSSDAIKPEEYLKLLSSRHEEVAQTLGLLSNEKWAILCITDHNVCSFSSKLSKIAWCNRFDSKLVILPGLELDISFQVLELGGTVTVHVCLIFSPCTTDAQIHTAISAALDNAGGIDPWDFGKAAKIKQLSTFINNLRNNADCPAICIAAHVGSSKGAQSEISELLRVEAEYARSLGELKILQEDTAKKEVKHSKILAECEKRVAELQKQLPKKKEQIALEVFRIIGECGFDALQVSDKETESHFRCLHRFREHMGRAVPILASDAHTIRKIYNCGQNKVPLLKMPVLDKSNSPLEFFTTLRDRSIRYGETRFTAIPWKRVNKWIRGIEIIPEAESAKRFWPFHPNSQFIMPFSRNLNCLIGGRGSGKSAMIEALAFVLEPKLFEFEAGKKKDTERFDWFKRARATLSGCNVRICWTAHEKNFEIYDKNSIFATRYFDQDLKFTNSQYSDYSGNLVMNEHDDLCKIELFRLSQLEILAEDDVKLRALFDRICGSEISALEKQIAEITNQLAVQRVDICSIAESLVTVTKEGGSLRNYPVLKKQYENVNTSEMQGKYKVYDQAASGNTTAKQACDNWRRVISSFEIKKFETKTANFVSDLSSEIGKEPKNEFLNPLHVNLFEKKDAKEPISSELTKNINNLSGSIDQFGTALKQSATEIAALFTTEKSSIESTGLPAGSSEREAKRVAFEKAEQALADYRKLLTTWEELMQKRKELFDQLKVKAKLRSNLRIQTAKKISDELKENLDPSILVVEADAQPMKDKNEFIKWLEDNWFPKSTKFVEKKVLALLENGINPENIQAFLLKNEHGDSDIMKSIEHARYRVLIPYKESLKENQIPFDSVPKEFQDGIWEFNSEKNKMNAALELDEIVYNDVPEVRLMDRPKEMEKARPIKELSAGQRCSAILPIILLSGEGPLIIDQPEDNLDNRLVREVVVNILAAMKLRRQIIIATHNPNLPVLGDSEQVLALRAVGQANCAIDAVGDIDQPSVVHSITEIMEGGREAFQYRQSVYQTHWEGPVLQITAEDQYEE